MDFSSQYQYGPGDGQTYGFLGPMQPLTPSHSASTGSDDFGQTSPPEAAFDAALAGDQFAGFDYSTGLTPGGPLGSSSNGASFPGPPTPPNAALAAHQGQHNTTMHGQHAEQGSPDKGNSEDDDLTPAQARRKAQNRAAQRAFRERKEKHVKDLETRLATMQASQQQASVENERLRRDLEKMSTENEILRATSSASTATASHHAHPSHSPPAVTTGPTEYRPTDFYSHVLQGHANKLPSHRIIVGDDGARLYAAGATWDLIVGHELFRRGLVDVGAVSERLRNKARCDGQGPVFPEKDILEAIEQSVASGSDDLL